MSDAVDATVAKLDFEPLSLRSVFLDTTFLKTQKSPLLVDSDYVISALRQQMVSAGVYLVETRDEADIIAEARMGALGLDGHSVTYGLPASNSLATASAALTSTPLLPAIPEISFARREAKTGAAKLAVFAYERETREPYWQSGIAQSTSNAKDTWILGAGPWQQGTIYNGTRFAGTRVAGSVLSEPKKIGKRNDASFRDSAAFSNYLRTRLFGKAAEMQATGDDAEASLVENSAPSSTSEQPAETSGESKVETASATSAASTAASSPTNSTATANSQTTKNL